MIASEMDMRSQQNKFPDLQQYDRLVLSLGVGLEEFEEVKSIEYVQGSCSGSKQMGRIDV